jgi:hypothetical protein
MTTEQFEVDSYDPILAAPKRAEGNRDQRRLGRLAQRSPTRRRWRKPVLRAATLGAFAFLSLVPPALAQGEFAYEGQAALNYLNEQRAANGIPPLTLNQEFATAWCPNEDGGPSGGEEARVFAGTGAWGKDLTPWDDSTLHELPLYDPAYTEAGIEMDGNGGVEPGEQPLGVECAGFGGQSPEPSQPTFYTYTSDEGPTKVSGRMATYEEGPFSFQELAGYPQGTSTGPQVILYARGMGSVEALSFSLSGPSGAVAGVKLVDGDTMAQAGHPGYGFGGVMVPPALSPGTYHASVVWQGASGQAATQSFAFMVIHTAQEAEAERSSHTAAPKHRKHHKRHSRGRHHQSATRGHKRPSHSRRPKHG